MSENKLIHWRKYNNLPMNLEPIIEGRTPSKWLFDNLYKISKEDFYNFNLTEQDLKDKYDV